MRNPGITILLAFLSFLPSGFTPHPLDHPQLEKQLEELGRRGISHRFSGNDLIELKDNLSGDIQLRSLREPSEGEIRAWADTEGVPILEIDPALIDTSQYIGWYNYWTEVPLSNSVGIPLIVSDVDGDGKAEVYGGYKEFMSPDFEARVYEIDSNGTVELQYSYVPRPGASRLIGDVDRDYLQEVIFSLGGLVYDYEQQVLDSLPTSLRFAHDRHQGNLDPGYTGIFLGLLDRNGASDLLYKGSEPDSSDSTFGITKVYVAEYDPDSTNFIRTWSTRYVPGPQSGIGGFAVADFDSDEKIEFAVSDLLSGNVFVTENAGDNAFVKTWSDSTPFVNLYYLTCGDVDGDARPEFFVGATMSNGNWTLVYEADSNDVYSLQFLFHLYAGGVLDSPTYLTNDIDGDGKLDLVIFSGAYLHVFKANGDNDYSLYYLKLEVGRHSVQFYDVSGDGIMDFLVSKDELDNFGRFRLYADVYTASAPVNVNEGGQIPIRTRLMQSYPNPFNPVATIQYSLSSNAHVSLTLYDVLGREVMRLVDGFVEGGTHVVTLDASSLASGIYLYKLQSGSFTDAKKLLLLK